jgi:ubiquinone/menaquinone biosynthesis C-methylase UbiE
MSDYNSIAYYYDLEYSQVSGDLDFYREMARQVGAQARILEVACGSGRVALPLLRNGFRVTGLDNSAQMLELARQKLAAEPDEVQKRGRFIEADMRDFNLKDEQFDLIFIALNSFQHLLTQADQLAFLKAVRRHLAPAGLFIVDTYNPEDKESYPADGRLELNTVFPNPLTGGKVYVFLSTTANPTEQQRHYTYFYDDTATDGSVRRSVTSFSLRYTYRYEMELLLDKAGFTLEDFYGSYEFDEYSTGSAKLIYVCRRG